MNYAIALASIVLSKEIVSVQGRELRLSSAGIQSGGHLGVHSHRNDLSIVFILSGVLTSHYDDGTVEELFSIQ